ncbi:MAG: hybrid sensor histidine kinase/response regulator [Proteobacteria bacterium]|nr:hybrid sensor histidine kinase/response regulator [Pseudomonadota bacterium]
MENEKIDILIVDDDEKNLMIIEEILSTNSSYRVAKANNGKTALKIMSESPADIVLSDIEMPEMDGFELCEKIRRNPEWSQIKIILISAQRTSVKDKVEGLHLKADDFLEKPIHFRELYARIQVFASLVMKERELLTMNQVLESKNEELQKFAEIGGLVAAVVHDAKKFTVAMTMGLRDLIIPILQEKLSHKDEWVLELMNDLNDAVFNGEQCTEFLESLLAIHRNEEIENVNVVKMIQKAISLLSYNMQKDKVEWNLVFDSNERYLAPANSQLIRVFMNLIANAHDALKRFEVKDPQIKITVEKPDEELMVCVSDNGPGMKPEVLESLRKGISVSTKGKGGNGLGVSGATKIVKTFNGRIEVDSELGNGAHFKVFLPRVSSRGEAEELDPLENVDFF